MFGSKCSVLMDKVQQGPCTACTMPKSQILTKTTWHEIMNAMECGKYSEHELISNFSACTDLSHQSFLIAFIMSHLSKPFACIIVKKFLVIAKSGCFPIWLGIHCISIDKHLII